MVVMGSICCCLGSRLCLLVLICRLCNNWLYWVLMCLISGWLVVMWLKCVWCWFVMCFVIFLVIRILM